MNIGGGITRLKLKLCNKVIMIQQQDPCKKLKCETLEQKISSKYKSKQLYPSSF